RDRRRAPHRREGPGRRREGGGRPPGAGRKGTSALVRDMAGAQVAPAGTVERGEAPGRAPFSLAEVKVAVAKQAAKRPIKRKTAAPKAHAVTPAALATEPKARR